MCFLLNRELKNEISKYKNLVSRNPIERYLKFSNYDRGRRRYEIFPNSDSFFVIQQ